MSCLTRFRFFVLFAIVALSFGVFINAQEEDQNTPQVLEEGEDIPRYDEDPDAKAPQRERDPSIFKLAWNIESYRETYDVAQRTIWEEPSSLGSAYAAVGTGRNRANGDYYYLTGFAAFRPFVLDFGKYSFSLGVSYLGGIAESDESDDFDQVDGALVTVTEFEGFVRSHVFAFSVLGSFPELGMQMLFDIGYSTKYLRADFDVNIFALVGGLPVNLNLRDYRFEQEDEGVAASFEVRKLFDRDYLNYFTFRVSANVITNIQKRRSKANLDADIAAVQQFAFARQDLPFDGGGGLVFPDPQEGQDYDTDYISLGATARLFTVPINIFEVANIRQMGISLDSGFEFRYDKGTIFGSEIDGGTVTAAASVSFWDVLIVGYTHSWAFSSDVEDSYGFFVAVGLYGGTETPSFPGATGAGQSSIN